MLNLIFAGKIEDFEEIDLNTFPVVARVDFIHTILAEELIAIVGTWVKGLNQNNDLKNPLVLLMKKYRKKIAQYSEYVSMMMLFVLFMGVGSHYIQSINIKSAADISIEQINFLFIIIVIGCMVIYLAKDFFEYAAQSIYDKLSEYGKVYIFKITRGDIQLQEDIQNKDKTSGRIILTRFIFSLIFNVACGIISALLV